MPKAIRVPLQVAAAILLCPGLLLIFAFPIVLAIKFPTQATADFLGLVLATSGALMMAWGIRSWLRANPRALHALIHQTPSLWAGLAFFVCGCLLGFFQWPDSLLKVLSFLASVFAGSFLFAGSLLPLMWETKTNQRARQAQMLAQENTPVRRRDSPFFIARMLFGSALGYALFFFTLNGQLSALLTAYLWHQPPFGLIPLWMFGVCGFVYWTHAYMLQVPASLRVQPPRQRFLFLLARRAWGAVIIFYAILFILEVSQEPSEGTTDLLLAILITLGAVAGLTYLAAWAVVWLSRWRAARHREA